MVPTATGLLPSRGGLGLARTGGDGVEARAWPGARPKAAPKQATRMIRGNCAMAKPTPSLCPLTRRKLTKQARASGTQRRLRFGENLRSRHSSAKSARNGLTWNARLSRLPLPLRTPTDASFATFLAAFPEVTFPE